MRTLQQIDIETYSKRTEHVCLLDARSEAEFLKGHIPGAVSFPLLNNQERVLVGTCYKTKGSFEAVVLGYELVAPKFAKMIKNAHMAFGKNKLIIHCWRGGLRSQILGNLLSSAGFEVSIKHPILNQLSSHLIDILVNFNVLNLWTFFELGVFLLKELVTFTAN